MYGIVFIISLLLSLLVILGGFFLLAYARKEGLGKLTKLASYVAIIFGTLCFVGGLVRTTMHGCCEKEGMKCHKEIRMECHEGMDMECHKGMKGGHCEKDEMEGCCKGMKGDADHCEKNATENCCKEKKDECPKSKCESMATEHCKKDGKDCCKEAIQKCNKEEAAKKAEPVKK